MARKWKCPADGDCDTGTLVTAPGCYAHDVQCIERCDSCEKFSDDTHAAASVASRIPTQVEFCRDGHTHFVIRQQA